MDLLKKTLLRASLILFCSLLVVVPVTVKAAEPRKQTPELTNEFYNDKYRGWYWFEDPPIKKDEEQTKASQSEPTDPREPSLDDYTYDEIWSMNTDDFQKLSDEIRKKAVRDPSEKNVYEYAFLQDIARRKAAAFAGTYMLVSQKYPYLGNRDVSPITTPGLRARTELQNENIAQTLFDNRENFGMFVFTSEGCGFCEAQASILEYFQKQYGWAVRYADINGGTQSANLAARHGIARVPAILLVHRESGDAMPVSQGVVSMSDLSHRLYRTIKYMNGERSPEQFFLYDYESGSGADPLSLSNQKHLLPGGENFGGKND
jgi:conjugal transfer pilus assembly protein TraF